MNKQLFWLSITALLITSCGKKNQPTPTATKTQSQQPKTVTVTTLAGGGSGTAADGQGMAASFNNPVSVAVDSSGTLFIADNGNSLIRKITPAGLVSTIVPNIRFQTPSGVAVDAAGNLYVTDYIDYEILGMQNGVVSFLAGGGPGTATDGVGFNASFKKPYAIAVNPAGTTVYVADGNNLIRKITSPFSGAAVVTTYSGNGTIGSANNASGTAATTASFNHPTGVAIDLSGNVYVADYNNNLIRKISTSGVVSTFAGGGPGHATNGTGTAASFYGPTSVATDAAGNVYVTDSNNYLIRRISPAGVVTTLAGNGTKGSVDGDGASAEFNNSNGIAVDAKGENVYVCDSSPNLIRKIVLTY